MRTLLCSLALTGCLACSDVPVPVIPTTPSPTIGPPASVSLSALAGIGNGYGQAYLVARIVDATGRGIGNAAVDFSATDGVFTPSHVIADSGGQAQTTLNTSARQVTVTAKSGDASSSIEVAINLPPAPIVSPPPILTPPPPPPTPPGPSPPPVAFAVSLACTGTSSPMPCNVSVTETGIPKTATVASVTWDWGDGSTTMTTAAAQPVAATTHAYLLGPYTVIATVTMQGPDTHTGSAQQSILVK